MSRMRMYVAASVAVVLLGASAACLMAMRALIVQGESRLARIGSPDFSTVTCQVGNSAVHSGPRVSLASEWLVNADVVTMIQTYQRRGWSPISFMGSEASDIKLLPLASEDYDMLIGRVRVYRSVSLSYTTSYTTRLVSITSAVFCPV